ncbi:ABC transporter ATP-binding protein [candidate division KSB1 bacterium]
MIEIRNLQKQFNEKPVLRGVNLTIKPGERIVVMGRSGCGKSVLLKHIIGLIKPDDGEIFIDGEDITRLKQKDLFEVRKKFGMLFQASALFDSMTVEENVSLALKKHTSLSDTEIKRKVQENLDRVGLPNVGGMAPSDLSGGMKKRVGLARALAMDPSYILYDEPTTGLDPIMADIIDSLVLEIGSSLNVTTIIVTHDIKSAFATGSRITMLHRGIIHFDGSVDEARNTTDPVLKQFIEGSKDGPIKPKTKDGLPDIEEE